jgi:nicotinamidase-related amidase
MPPQPDGIVRRVTAKARNRDLHGNVPENSPVALLLIDVINAMEFEGGAEFAKRAEPAARCIADLKQRARAARVPTVYANDNFGRWTSDFRQVVEHCRKSKNGREIVRLLEPAEDDYFVLKPKQSAFFATTLETLLLYLGARTLVLAGFATDMCVLFSAHDAYLRDYALVVPRDCVTASSDEAGERALVQLGAVLKADIRESREIDFGQLLESTEGEG